VDVDRRQLAGLLPIEATTRSGHEEIQQVVLATRGVHEHEAAGPGPGERRLGHEGHQHAGHGGVDGIAALAQHIGSRVCGERMAGCDHPSHDPQVTR
jgi:hypothetical protein